MVDTLSVKGYVRAHFEEAFSPLFSHHESFHPKHAKQLELA